MKRFRWPRVVGGFLYILLILYLIRGIYQDFVLLAPTSFEFAEGQRVIFGTSIGAQDSSTVLSQLGSSIQENNWSTSFLLQSQSPIARVFLDYITIYDDTDIPTQVCFKTVHLSKNEKVPIEVVFETGTNPPMGTLSDSEKEYVFTFHRQLCLNKGGKYFLPHLFLGSITVDAYSDLLITKVNGFRSFDFFPFDEQKIQLDMGYRDLENESLKVPGLVVTISQKGWLGDFDGDANKKTILHLKRPAFYKSILVLFFLFMLPVIMLTNNVVRETGSFFEISFGLLLGLWGTHEILIPSYIQSSIPIDFAIYVLYILVIGEIFIVLSDKFFIQVVLKRRVRIVSLDTGQPAQEDQPRRDEYIEIENSTPFPIDITNWLLYDKDGNKFKFPAYVLQGKKFLIGQANRVKIWTKAGRNDSSNLYWGRRSNNVWNKSGESAYLEDSSGELIDTYPKHNNDED